MKKPLQSAPLFTFNKDEPITIEVVESFINKHRNYLGRYEYLYNLYINHPEIYDLKDKAKYKPDNRVAIPFVKYGIDTFCGYFNGIPVKKSHDNKDFLSSLATFDNANDMEDEESELLKLACIYGHAFEYLYQNEQTKTRAIYISPKEMFIVYDNTFQQLPLFAVYYGVSGDKVSGKVITLSSIIELKQTDAGFEFGEEDINPYDGLPVVEWILNDERTALLEAVITMVNTYNKTVSEKANDVEYFSDAYMKILGTEIDEETIKAIGDNRIINMFGGEAGKIVVEFMDKPDSDAQTENLLNRLEKLIYQTSMVANISDENFGSSSGISMAYKLQAMSNLALSIQRKFQSSLNRRYQLFSSLRTNVPESMKNEWEGISYTFTRNEPKNVLEEAQTAAQLMGITSNETALSVLSVVNDVTDELQKIEKEQPNLMDFEMSENNGQQDVLEN